MGKPCYERQHSSKNCSDKPTEKSRYDDHDSESRAVTNPYLEKARDCLEQYGYRDEEEKILHDKSTPRLKSKDKVEQRGNVLANVFDDRADSVDPRRSNFYFCNAMGIEKDTPIMDTPWQMFQVLDLLDLRLGNQIKHVFSTQRQATVDLV